MNATTEPQIVRNEAHGTLMEAAPTADYDYVKDSELCDTYTTHGRLTSHNPAYGEVTRAEDDQDYYFNKGMGGAAKIRMTSNEAYGISRQAMSDNDFLTESTGASDTYDYVF